MAVRAAKRRILISLKCRCALFKLETFLDTCLNEDIS
ncbi:unnamed protein product [Haemonchus placei]|uniref:Uncharacterized protein n=1 Tax=Haemonchus placei TaxID=6290 RepID=A0A0N4X216_HAEPC|nr:unnamed protein product [Haemonchus placei]